MSIRIIAQKDGRFVWDKFYMAAAQAMKAGERLIAENKADYVSASGYGKMGGYSSLSKSHGWTPCTALEYEGFIKSAR